MPVVTIKPGSGDEALITPTYFLGRELFGRYLLACTKAGARYLKTANTQVCPARAVPAVVAALKEQGFEVGVDPAIAQHLTTQADALEEKARAARARVEALATGLAESGLRPFRFQVEGIVWLEDRQTAILADEPGLGKTIEALLALPEEEPAVLVIAPANAKWNWADETRRWRKDIERIDVLQGSRSFRWPRRGELVITNYDVLPETLTAVPPEGVIVIADECHYVKNAKAQRTQRFRELADVALVAKGKLWGLSGTPLLNRPQELWSLLQTFHLAREAFPGGWKEFVGLFHGHYRGGWGGMEWGEPDPAVAERLRAVMLRRVRTEVLPDLPTKMHKNVLVERLDPEARAQADAVVDQLRRLGIDLDAAVKAGDTSWLKVAFAETEIMSARRLLAEAKIPLMLEMVEEYEEQAEPLIVFCSHLAPIRALAKRQGWAVITGDTPSFQRQQIKDQFQAGGYKGLGISIAAGGVALTLTWAHHALFVDLDWTPANNSQAEDRICRIGQDRGVVITRLLADHYLDLRVCELLVQKQALIDASVEQARVQEGATGAREEKLAQALREAAAEAREIPAPQEARPNPRRGPRTTREQWAAQALLALAAMDPDRAMELNAAGFNRLDGPFGHKLAEQVQYGLTEKQWSAAIRLVWKYQRQVGAPPQEEARERAEGGAA